MIPPFSWYAVFLSLISVQSPLLPPRRSSIVNVHLIYSIAFEMFFIFNVGFINIIASEVFPLWALNDSEHGGFAFTVPYFLHLPENYLAINLS